MNNQWMEWGTCGCACASSCEDVVGPVETCDFEDRRRVEMLLEIRRVNL